MLILADLNQGRPWWRERVPGLEIAISKQRNPVELVDVFEAVGQPQLSECKLFERRVFFGDRFEMIAAQKRLLEFFNSNNYSHILFSTMDICQDFLDTKFLFLNYYKF